MWLAFPPCWTTFAAIVRVLSTRVISAIRCAMSVVLRCIPECCTVQTSGWQNAGCQAGNWRFTLARMSTPQAALKTAIRIAGGHVATAKALGISRQAVSRWRVAPITRVLEIERLAEGRVRRDELRPDIFGPDAAVRREEGAVGG